MFNLLTWILGGSGNKGRKVKGGSRSTGRSVRNTSGVWTKAKSKSFGAHKGQHQVVTVYHGTPSASNIKSIRRDGWQIGSGNAYGDGIYFSHNLAEAKGYAGSSGVIVKCRVVLGKSATWNTALDKQYQTWCKGKQITADSSAKTAFLLKHGFKTLQAGTIVVVLKPQFSNQTAYRQKVREITIISVHNATNLKQIQV
jgi:hypothetical protein